MPDGRCQDDCVWLRTVVRSPRSTALCPGIVGSIRSRLVLSPTRAYLCQVTLTKRLVLETRPIGSLENYEDHFKVPSQGAILYLQSFVRKVYLKTIHLLESFSHEQFINSSIEPLGGANLVPLAFGRREYYYHSYCKIIMYC